MLIRFIKGKPGSLDMLVCERGDGPATGSRFRAVHDLAHYAVETTFELRESFYGLLEDGWDIDSFDTPGAVRALNIPLQASQTEFVVGLLEIELLNGAPYSDFSDQISKMCKQSGVEPPCWLNADGVLRARKEFGDLLARWSALAVGDSLELEFDSGLRGTA